MPVKTKRRSFGWLLLGIATLGALTFGVIRMVPDDTQQGRAAIFGENGTNPEEFSVPGDLWLVNGSHPWDGPESGTLLSVYGNKPDCYNVRDTTVLVEERILEPLNRMLEDFSVATGRRDLLLCAGYRTREEQQALWERAVETRGADHANSYLAKPGTSEHHTGLAVDFSFYDVSTGETCDFDGSGDSAWILEHCWEYGFVQRYPAGKADITGISTEPWHFRYVGPLHAYLIHEKGFCLEEYLEFLRQYPEDGEHLTVEYGGTSYELWYTPTVQTSGPDGVFMAADNCGGTVEWRTAG